VAGWTGLGGLALEAAAASLWQPQLDWLRGRRNTTGPAGGQEPPDARGARLRLCRQLEAGGEAERVAAACGLGRMGALGPLVRNAAATAPEGRHRAAVYGLAAAGDAAVPPLVRLLEEPSPLPGRPLFRREKLVHALGRAATTPASLAAAMGALAAAAADAHADLAACVAEVPAAEHAERKAKAKRGNRGYDTDVFNCLLPPDRRADEGRGALAEAARAAGLLASQAMVAEAARGMGAAEAAAICRDAVGLLVPRPPSEPRTPNLYPGSRSIGLLWNFPTKDPRGSGS
jgi:hypothetical protein